jgi:transcriptional regulator with XRE-family HTH domain
MSRLLAQFFQIFVDFFCFKYYNRFKGGEKMDNKYIFSKNLQRLMNLNNVSRKDVANVLGISYFTVSDWVNGKKYPRMDKVELLANYFGVLKSDLIEEEVVDKPQLPQSTTTITEGEQMLLDLFRMVPEDKQQMVLQMIRAALNTK